MEIVVSILGSKKHSKNKYSLVPLSPTTTNTSKKTHFFFFLKQHENLNLVKNLKGTNTRSTPFA
jgi:hypothetical protein